MRALRAIPADSARTPLVPPLRSTQTAMTGTTAFLIALSLAGNPVADIAACLELCASQQSATAQDDCMDRMGGVMVISDDSTSCPVPAGESVFVREENRTTSIAPVSIAVVQLPTPLSMTRPAWTSVPADRVAIDSRSADTLVLRL
jgi:hypothetical protein